MAQSSGLVGTTKDPNAKPAALWRRRGAIVAIIHDLGAALGFAIIMYYAINASIFFITEISFKLYTLNQMYGEIYDEEDTYSKKKKIACCWHEYRKYNLYNDIKKDNL